MEWGSRKYFSLKKGLAVLKVSKAVDYVTGCTGRY
jgi:hypothetical protein